MSRLALRFGWLVLAVVVVAWTFPARVAAEDVEPREAAVDPEPTPEELAEAEADARFRDRFDRLLRTIDEGVGHDKVEAAWTLAFFIGKAERVVPQLEKMLKSKDDDARIAAAAAHWHIRHDPEIVLPALLGSLNQMTEIGEYRNRTLMTLADLGPHGAPAVPRLIELYRQSDADAKEQIAETLGEIGQKAKAAIPALVESLGDHTEMYRSPALAGSARPAAC